MHPLDTLLYRERLLLVGCCVSICRLAADLRHRVFYFHYFCVTPFDVPNDVTAFPHALHPPHAPSPESFPPLMPALGWLLCLPFKCWPLKAKAPFRLYFSTCVVFCPPNKSTNSSTTKPDHRCLAWDHRRPRGHVLWAPLTYPWIERAKPLEGRVMAAHFVVVCLLCFCVLCCDVLLANRLVEA